MGADQFRPQVDSGCGAGTSIVMKLLFIVTSRTYRCDAEIPVMNELEAFGSDGWHHSGGRSAIKFI